MTELAVFLIAFVLGIKIGVSHLLTRLEEIGYKFKYKDGEWTRS